MLPYVSLWYPQFLPKSIYPYILNRRSLPPVVSLNLSRFTYGWAGSISSPG